MTVAEARENTNKPCDFHCIGHDVLVLFKNDGCVKHIAVPAEPISRQKMDAALNSLFYSAYPDLAEKDLREKMGEDLYEWHIRQAR